MRILASLLVLSIYLLSFGDCETNKNWNALYSFTEEKAYVHLKNNDLVMLNFSISGLDSQGFLELKNGQQINALSSPPENSTLVIIDGNLYGFVSNITATNSEKDTCGGGLLSLVKYNNETDSWSEVQELGYGNIDEASYLQHASYISSPTIEGMIYIYGGLCEINNQVSNRILSFDLSTLEFSNITTSTKPLPFYGAANALGPDSQTQILIGGQSEDAWLNMYQLATWDFNSGWSFQQVTKDNDIIDSRKYALALPVFNQLSNNSIQSIASELEVLEIILIGGDLVDEVASPTFAKLSIKNSNWVWENITTNMDYDEIFGAITLFETLVVINSSDYSKRDGRAMYTVNLYNIENFQSVESVVSTKTTSNNSSSGTSTAIKNKAIIGSVFSVCGVAIGIIGSLYYVKRRKKQREINDLNNMDYQIGNFYDQESTLSEKSRNFMNDTNSTLEVASFESWFQKRKRYDEERLKPIRTSYLPSNDTLSSDTSASELAPLTPATIHKSSFKTQISPIQNALINRSMSKIKDSFLLSGSQPMSPTNISDTNSIKPKRSIIAISNKRHSSHSELSGTHEQRSIDINRLDEIEQVEDIPSESESYIDDEVDVQVLVSSKRRSVLRITNPDLDRSLSSTREDLTALLKDNIPEELESGNNNDLVEYISQDAEKSLVTRKDSKSSLRQRVPSAEKTLDV